MYAFLLYSYILELIQHFSKARWIHKRAYEFIPTFFSVLILNQNFIYFFFFNLWDFHNCFVLFPLFFCSVYVFQIVTCLKYFSWREIIYLNQCVVCLWCVSFPYITMCWKKDWLGGMWLFVYPFIIDFLSGEGGGLIGKHCLVGLLLFNKIFITSFNGHF